MSYLTDMSAWLADAGPCEEKELAQIFNFSSRDMSKSVFQDLYMARPRIERKADLRGISTTNALVVDEVSELTIDGLHRLKSRMRGDDGLSGLFPLDGFTTCDKKGPFIWDVLSTFEDLDHPECTVYASLEKIDRRDPRNPNPNAGAVRRFFVTHEGRQEQVRNKTMAIARAEALHKRLVAEKKARLAEEERLRRLEQERQFEEARRNNEHLQALPAFGGF